MKKIVFTILICFFIINIASCNKKYELTDNAVLLEYGKQHSSSFVYDGEYYYLPSNKVVVGLENSNQKGKFSICIAYYDKTGNVTNVTPQKTYVLKKNQTASIALASGETEGYENGEYYRYTEWKEVIMLYEGYNLYVDSSYFE